MTEHNFDYCIKCTICTAYCPVTAVNPLFPGPKQAGPDGERLRLKNGYFYDSALKYCLNCKRCESACPSGVKIADIIHSARRKYSHERPSFRNLLLANTDFMGKAARPVAPLVNALTASAVGRLAMDGLLRIDRHRQFPKYQAKGFRSWFKREAQPQQESFPHKVAFFHGCSTEFQHPETGIAFVRLMNAIGYGVELLDESCCGVAMISNGLWKQAERTARHNIGTMAEAISRGLPILTLSSTCTLTIRDEYPNVLDIDNSAVREHIFMVEKFLYGLLDRGEISFEFRRDFHAKVAYHVPCHLEKAGWSLFTRRLLKMIPGLELVELDSNCCGMAGTYGFKKENYEASQAIGKPLFDQIRSVNPDYVACECETCKWQIEMSTGYSVLNPVQILADAIVRK